MNPFLPFLFLALLCCGINLKSLGQESPDLPDTNGVKINQDPRIWSLVEKHLIINDIQKGMPGYRVQIYFGSDKKAALEAKADFIEKHPGYEGYVIYEVPYFKVRAGDFRTHLEAEKLEKELVLEYPGTFIVKDMITVPELQQ